MKRFTACLIATSIALAGCTPNRIQGTGKRADPPAGWIEYCHRHPEDKSCSA